MASLIENIAQLQLDRSKEKFQRGLDALLELLLKEIQKEHETLIRDDIKFFWEKSKWSIHNTFAGGIIFLREPEIIERITIHYVETSNEAIVAVHFGSRVRNARNIKHKEYSGQMEQSVWRLKWIFPNFTAYDADIKEALWMFIGNYVKTICEDLNQNSWFAKYEHDFDIYIFSNNVLLLTIPVKAI